MCIKLGGMDSKELIVLGGPNGAGKSTLAAEYVSRYQYPFLSADSFASQLSPQNPALAQVAAGRAFMDAVNDALAGNDGFIIESTLSGRSLAGTLRKARRAGFMITIAYVFLDSADTCVHRVHERARKGGHFVPE